MKGKPGIFHGTEMLVTGLFLVVVVGLFVSSIFPEVAQVFGGLNQALIDAAP